MNARIAAIAGVSILFATLLIGTVGAVSTSGACHGAFANVNGNFGFLGAVGGTPGYHNGAVGQQVGATGYNNGALSGDCTLPSGQ